MSWNRVHFSSATDQWETPSEVFGWASEKFGPLELDVCAGASNTKCEHWIEADSLGKDWDLPFWMNPPYGRGIGEWVKRAFESSQYNRVIGVCLLPARTDTRWFHDYCTKGEVYFLRGRLKFGGAKNSAPFPSMIVVFGLAR